MYYSQTLPVVASFHLSKDPMKQVLSDYHFSSERGPKRRSQFPKVTVRKVEKWGFEPRAPRLQRPSSLPWWFSAFWNWLLVRQEEKMGNRLVLLHQPRLWGKSSSHRGNRENQGRRGEAQCVSVSRYHHSHFGSFWLNITLARIARIWNALNITLKPFT